MNFDSVHRNSDVQEIVENDAQHGAMVDPEESEEASAMLQLPCSIRPRSHDDSSDEVMSLMQLPHFKDLSKQPQFVEQLAKKRQAAEAAAEKFGFGIEVKDGEDLESMFQLSRQE